MGAVNDAIGTLVANEQCGWCRADIHSRDGAKRWCNDTCERRHRLTLKHQSRFNNFTGFDVQPINQRTLDMLGFDVSGVRIIFGEHDAFLPTDIEGKAVITNARDGWDWITRPDKSCWEVVVNFGNGSFEVSAGRGLCEPQPQCVGDLKALISRVSRRRVGVVL